MLLLTIDPSAAQPAYLQIRDRIIELIDGDTLRAGDRLPPTRQLADDIGVHRSTVVRAYEEVRALGYLESRMGSYSTVRRRARPPTTKPGAGNQTGSGIVDWSSLPGPTVRNVCTLDAEPHVAEPGRGHVIGFERAPAPHDLIDFERLAADPALAPSDDLRHCFKAALLRSRGTVLDYSDPAGWRPLRETVATRMRAHGVAVSADEVLITGGAQHALDLVLRMLTRPGDPVAVEAPTYGMAHQLLRLHGLEALEVPMGDKGMDLEALEHLLRRTRPKLVYTIPNFHNPTGVTTNQAHRERLLAVCEHGGLPIVEDGFEEELKYTGHAVLPIKSMDARGVVLYIGTFSKVVFPGLRVGWIAGPREAIRPLAAIQHTSCLAGNTLAQAAVDRFCRSGLFESYLRRIHRVYRRRMQAMLRGLEAYMPPGVEWTRPVGGYTLWLTLPGNDSESIGTNQPVSETQSVRRATADICEGSFVSNESSPLDAPVLRQESAFCRALADVGLRVAPGSRFFGKPPQRLHCRLSISCVEEARITEGCRRLGEVCERWMVGELGRLGDACGDG